MTIALPETRGVSFTVIGAVSTKMGLVHFYAFKGTNNVEHFKTFI
jgi:hypothetical protein